MIALMELAPDLEIVVMELLFINLSMISQENGHSNHQRIDVLAQNATQMFNAHSTVQQSFNV